MIDIALGRRVLVFLATIAPVAPGGPNNIAVSRVIAFNAKVRDLAARRSVPLVDVYAALSIDVPRYYVGDDLHPTGEALRVIGETFFAAVRSALDITPTDMSPAFSPAASSLLPPPSLKRR